MYRFAFIFHVMCFGAGGLLAQSPVLFDPDSFVRKEIRNYRDPAPDTFMLSTFFFNAIAIKCEQQDVEASYFLVGGQRHHISADEHADSDEHFTSKLILLGSPTDMIVFNPGNLIGYCEVYFINSSFAGAQASTRTRAPGTDCSLPASIDQSVWRAGLAAPDYARSYTTVEHVIVHHSAGSNSSANFMEDVRAIYLYHTQVNGWSDIGYNYLIDPNGVIYEGRDPASGAQDNVVGAHFCGKNSGTMGVCLMGTYTAVAPSELALSSLWSLVSWKIGKEELDPLGSRLHNGIALPSIAGHRDGCATECPGEMTYAMLQEIRNDVADILEVCNQEAPLFNLYPIPVSPGNTFHVTLPEESAIKVSVLDAQGRAMGPLIELNNIAASHEFDFPDLASGVYLVTIRTAGKTYIRRASVVSN